MLLETITCSSRALVPTPVVCRNHPSRPQLLFQSWDEHVVSNVTSSSAQTGTLALVLQGKGKHLSVRPGPIVVDVTIVIGIHL